MGIIVKTIMKQTIFIKKIILNVFIFIGFMALIPFKTTEKQGKASSKSIFSLALVMTSLVVWMCLFK